MEADTAAADERFHGVAPLTQLNRERIVTV